MKVVTLFVRHGTNKYPQAESKLEHIFSTQLADLSWSLLVIDNALPASFQPEQSGFRTVIAGDNTAWEFSGWNKGLEALGDEIWSYDLVHLATSAFHTLYTEYLDRFDSRMLAAVSNRPVCVGHIDAYNEPVQLFSYRSQHWLRTSFIFLPVLDARLLGSLVSLSTGDGIFSSSPSRPFLPDAPLSSNYRRFIIDWLTGEDIGQGTVWHSKLSLAAEDFPLFKAKALAILNEHLLGLRLRAQGTSLVDATWLASQLAVRHPAAIQWTTSWRDQLANRDSDAIAV